MKVWLLTSETPLFNPGGIARYVDNFARYLAKGGHDVTVFGRDEENRNQEIIPGYKYVSVVARWELCSEPSDSPRPDEHPSFPYNVLDYWGAFSYQIAEAVLHEISVSGAPDIIESQEYGALPYYLLQRKLTESGPLQSIPVVINAHSPVFVISEFNEEPTYQFPHYWTGRLEMACLHAADSVICASGYLSRQLEERFGNSIQVSHFPYPWTDPDKLIGGHAVDRRKVIYFGRLEIRKGILKFLECCTRLWEQGDDFTLHLLGGDTHYSPRACSVGDWIRKKYSRWIEKGILVLPGQLEHGQLMQEIQTASFTVVPSTWENWPNTCIEAMSLGKVVVGSTNGGQAEMIGDDGSCGFVFSWDEQGSCEAALKAALDLSDEERTRMGANARERIAGLCAPEVVMPRRLAHFESLLKPRLPKLFPFTNRHLRQSDAKDRWKMDTEEADTISVVIPYYNLGKYIESTVESAMALGWDRKEVILVDDGSDDPESLEALTRLEGRNLPNLVIHRQSNLGLAEARNTGARLAKGEFLLLLDADDQIDPSFAGKAVDVLRRYDNVHVVYTWERYMEASEDIYPCWNFEFPYLLAHNMTCPVSLLYRRSYLSFGPSKKEMAFNFEDYELWINLVKNGCGGVALIEPLSLYRVRKESMWQGSPREQHLFLQDLITRLHPELFRAYGPELFCLQNANGASQKWVKPSANSPFDEYEQWSRRRIAFLEKDTRRWWEKSVEAEARLKASEEEKLAVWNEKNRLEEQLEDHRKGGTTKPS